MSDEYQNTPPPGSLSTPNVLEHRVNSMEMKFSDLKKLTILNRESLIELVGSSGKNGRIGFMSTQMEDVNTELSEIKNLMENQRRFIWKLCLGALCASAGGAGITQAIMQAMGGG